MNQSKISHTPAPCHQTYGWAAGHFRILSKDNALPLVAFSLTKTVDKNGKEEARQYTEFDLADKLRQRGWVLPAYTMAPDARWIPADLENTHDIVMTLLLSAMPACHCSAACDHVVALHCMLYTTDKMLAGDLRR